jgi:Methyltransferase domain
MSQIPWWMKIGAKIVLSRLPISYSVWRRMSLFKHGSMDDPASAIEIFHMHMRNAGLASLAGLRVLELGPGDSVASAVIAHAYGAAEVCLVDVGAFARMDMPLYRRIATELRNRGLNPINVEPIGDIAALLEACNSSYLTEGLVSLQSLPDERFDFIWSNAVLEHVDRSQFRELLTEHHRLMTGNGTSSHRVDLQDHLDESLNSLRFSERFWEAGWVKRSGFYTNRLRCSEVLAAFDRAGLVAFVTDKDYWPKIPVPHRQLARQFRRFADTDLCIRWIDVRAQRPPQHAQVNKRSIDPRAEPP